MTCPCPQPADEHVEHNDRRICVTCASSGGPCPTIDYVILEGAEQRVNWMNCGRRLQLWFDPKRDYLEPEGPELYEF